jgi:hypothetical protein
MPIPGAETREIFRQLQPGDQIEVVRRVTVGRRCWQVKTSGVVVRAERRRHGLHHRRNFDDQVFSDVIVLRKADGELTTITLDEFTVLLRQPATAHTASPSPA